MGWLANPIYSKDGNYPAVLIRQIGKNSKQEGRLRSRLPTFSHDWIEKIRNSADFLGLNYYSSRLVEANTEPIEAQNPSVEWDRAYNRKIKPEWKQSHSDWLHSVPEGLRDLLRYHLLKISRRVTRKY